MKGEGKQSSGGLLAVGFVIRAGFAPAGFLFRQMVLPEGESFR